MWGSSGKTFHGRETRGTSHTVFKRNFSRSSSGRGPKAHRHTRLKNTKWCKQVKRQLEYYRRTPQEIFLKEFLVTFVRRTSLKIQKLLIAKCQEED